MTTLNQSELVKIEILLNSLKHTMEEIGLVADEVEDKKLRTALDGLAEESCHYADELRLQLNSMGITYKPTNKLIYDGSDKMTKEDAACGGDEISYICKRNENYLVNAYRNILNEYFPLPTLKEILLYQLEALRCGFMKINLLNTARYA